MASAGLVMGRFFGEVVKGVPEAFLTFSASDTMDSTALPRCGNLRGALGRTACVTIMTMTTSFGVMLTVRFTGFVFKMVTNIAGRKRKNQEKKRPAHVRDR